ncbi:MAG: endolytic transglycosylase MltG [Candidatus Spechtbacterales bacterium]
MLRKLPQFTLLAFIAVDFIAIVFLLYLTLGSLGSADSGNKELVEFIVEKGQGARGIASNLEKDGIISNDLFFNYYAWQKRSANLLQAGEYELSPSMTIPEIVRIFTEGKVKFDPGIRITIPEGYTTKKIEDVLISGGLGVKKSELQEAVGITAPLAKEIFGFSFLGDLPPRATLDGFLFPDTYFFEEDASLNDIVKRMLANFDSKVSDALRVKIKARGKNLYEVVIMASLIEKEVRAYEDMRVVSGILWKRMAVGMPLQADATLAHLTGKKTGEITNDDKLIDSPYNTYKYRGLPPTPIANPGFNAIKAAADPEESEYLYYLSTPQGETIFSKTLDEHNQNRVKYLY